MTSTKRKNSAKSRKLKRSTRLLIGLSISAFLVWLLPALVPDRYVRDALHDALEGQFDGQITIEDATLSWFDGVRIEKITIDDRAGTGTRITVQDVEIPFEPTKLFFLKKVSSVRLQGVQIELDARNGPPELPIRPATASSAIVPQRVQLDDCRITILWPTDAATVVTIPWAEVTFDAAATATWRGHARVEYLAHPLAGAGVCGRVDSFGKFSVVEQGGQTCYSGKVNVSWRDLDLESLKLDQALASPLAELTGRSSGGFTFEIFPDFHFEWKIDSEFENLTVRHVNADQPTKIDRLAVSVGGAYDPVTGEFELENFDILGQAIALKSKLRGHFEPAVADGPGKLYLGWLDLAGTFEAALLVEHIPALGQMLKATDQIAGPCEFQLHWNSEAAIENVALKLTADQAIVQIDHLLDKPAGIPLQLEFALQADQANVSRMNLSKLAFKLAGLELEVQGDLPRLDGDGDGEGKLKNWLDEVKRSSDLKLAIRFKDAEKLADYLPRIREYVDLTLARGPMEFDLQYRADNDQATAHLKAHLSEQASIAFADWWKKPAGQPLALDLACTWAWDDPVPQLSAQFRLAGPHAEIKTVGSDRAAQLAWSFNTTEQNRPQIDFAFNIPVSVRDVDALFAYSPELARRLARNGIRLAGDADLDIQGAVRLRSRSERWELELARVQLSANAGHAAIDLADEFRKPIGVPLTTSIQLAYGRDEQMRFDWDLLWQQLRSSLILCYTPGPSSEITGRYRIKIDDLESALAAIPRIERDWLGDLKLAGGIDGEFQWRTGRKGEIETEAKEGEEAHDEVSWRIDATRLAVKLDDRDLKMPGLDCSLAGTLYLTEPDPYVREYRASAVKVRFGQSFVNLNSGTIRRLKVPADRWVNWAARLGVEPWLAWRHTPIEQADLQITGRLALGAELRMLSEKLARWCRAYQADGFANFAAQARLQDGVLTARIETDLEDLGFTHSNLLTKPPGVPGVGLIQINCWPAEEPGQYYCQLDPLELRLGPARLTAEGYSKFNVTAGKLPHLTDAQIHIEIPTVELSQLRELCETLAQLKVAGRSAASIHAAWDGKRLALRPSRVTFDRVRAVIVDKPVTIDGSIDFSDDYLNLDDLRLTADESDLTARCMLLVDTSDDPTEIDRTGVLGAAALESTRLDLGGIAAIARGFIRTLTHAPATAKFGPKEFDPIRKILANSRFAVTFDGGDVRTLEVDSDVQHQLDDLICRLALDRDRDGRAVAILNYRGHAYDGTVAGEITAFLDEPNPTVLMQTDQVNLKMNPALQPMIEDFFPGMVVNGNLTIRETIRQKMFTTAETGPNYPVGTGELIFTDGYLIGRAAPDWLTRIFPGLNLTKYSFSRMHNWSTRDPDGIVHNNMIFRGTWNIYMEGISRPDNTVEYEVGVDLLARFESQYWSSVGQGRVPIFTSTGKIVNRKFVDQNIEYVPLKSVLKILENNLFTGIYRVLHRRFAGETPLKKKDR